MSSKFMDGQLDGLLSPDDEWVTDTPALHKLIKNKIDHMYATGWYPRLIQDLLWSKKEENGLT